MKLIPGIGQFGCLGAKVVVGVAFTFEFKFAFEFEFEFKFKFRIRLREQARYLNGACEMD